MEYISIVIAIIGAVTALVSARNSASKDIVEGLKHLIDSLEKRLEKEIREREKLEIKISVYEKYIEILLDQLRRHNIKPADMPTESSIMSTINVPSSVQD